MRQIVGLYLFSIAYAIVRYVAFTPENWANLPVFVLNKGISMAAAVCFAIAFFQQWRRLHGVTSGNEPAVWFRAGLFGALAHVPMSLMLLRPAYFREFFAGDRMSFNGEAVVLFGALTLAGLYLLARTTWSEQHRWWLSLATVGVLFSHTLSMGIARGININRSHAYLPPMWMLSLIGIAAGGAFLLLCRPSRQTTSKPM